MESCSFVLKWPIIWSVFLYPRGFLSPNMVLILWEVSFSFPSICTMVNLFVFRSGLSFRQLQTWKSDIFERTWMDQLSDHFKLSRFCLSESLRLHEMIWSESFLSSPCHHLLLVLFFLLYHTALWNTDRRVISLLMSHSTAMGQAAMVPMMHPISGFHSWKFRDVDSRLGLDIG